MKRQGIRVAVFGACFWGTMTAALGDANIATVNGQPIPASAVQSMVLRDPSVVNPILDQLINNALVDQEAARRHAEPTRDEIEGRKQQLMGLNHLSNLDGILHRHHETMADLEQDIRVWVETVKLLTPAAKLPAMVAIRHILVRVAPSDPKAPQPSAPHTDAEALKIIQNIQTQLKGGKSFGDLAKEYSEDSAAKDNGGVFGVAYEGGPLEPSLSAAALTLKKPGELFASPVKSSDGYHLIQAVSTGDRHPKSEDPLYANIAMEVRAQSVTDAQTQALVKGLRDQARIVNHYSGD